MATPLVSTRPRTQLELMTTQLAGLERWLSARDRWQTPEPAGLTREARMDLERQRAALRREHEAVVARAKLHQMVHVGTVHDVPRTRALLAHRNQWLRDKVAGLLSLAGVTVVGSFDDGADTAGTLVVEQPDLVFVEDRLPSLAGGTVVQRAREFAPGAVVAVQVMDSAGVADMLDAGAHAVFTRRIPPAEVVERLVLCLGARAEQVVLV